MKRICLLILLLAVGISVVTAEETNTVTSADIQAMERKIQMVGDPAARLFYQANIYRAKGEMEEALKSLAKLTALHAHNEEWITRSELLSAMLYLEVGLPEAAEATSRQVEFLNEGTDAAEQARRFLETAVQVKKQSEEVE